jgi:hypothetical protein
MAKGLFLAAAGAWHLCSCAAGPPEIDFSPARPDDPPEASTSDRGIRLLGYVAAREGGGAPAASRDAAENRATSSRSPETSSLASADARAVGETVEAAGESGDGIEACSYGCERAADHLLLSEIVTRPSGSEMIEIVNPTSLVVDLSNYWIADTHLYYRVAPGDFSTASGSDFAARFPAGALIGPGEFRTVTLANASGGTVSFAATYGRKPDFELRPTANGAGNDGDVPDMLSADSSSTIGATASLTDAGEPVVLFYRADGATAYDVDYVFFGEPSASNAVVDKTAEPGYLADTPADRQHSVLAPGESGALHRCDYGEAGEARAGGNGITGHDETSEDTSRSFAVTTAASLRTPGGPPPPGACVR